MMEIENFPFDNIIHMEQDWSSFRWFFILFPTILLFGNTVYLVAFLEYGRVRVAFTISEKDHPVS